MALLGTFKDVVRGVSLGGVTTATVAHSLRAAVPDRTGIELRSMASASANSTVFAFGANGSISTIQSVQPSAAAAAPGVTAFDVWNEAFWSPSR